MRTMVARRRVAVNFTLSPEAVALLAGLAERSGQSRSATVERLVRDAVARSGAHAEDPLS